MSIENGEISEKLKKECIEYFCQNPIWKKLLKGFLEKYRSHGRFCGKVQLQNLKAQDIEELEGFFGKNFHGQKSVTVSSEQFQKTLEGSRYKGITPEYLLEKFWATPLIGKQEQKLLREKEKKKILLKFEDDYKNTPIETQISVLLQIVKDNEKQKLLEWEKMLRLGADIYNHLPYRNTEINKDSKNFENYLSGNDLYLSVFAAVLTGNPHAFDQGTADGTFLYQVIQMDLEIRNIHIEASKLFPAYKRQKSYMLAGIMLDDISNYAMLYNVQALKKDGSMHKGMEGFASEGHIVQIPLAVIAEWKKIFCPQNEIYIVENPSVFAVLSGKESRCKSNTETKKAYMCMNGQPRLAGLVVIELLAKTETKIYYSGDLDPEGILIAQKLSKFYKGEFNYWHMQVSDYKKCKSNENISAKRMKILERITDIRLVPVVKEIQKCATSGYQEMLIEEMLKEI